MEVLRHPVQSVQKVFSRFRSQDALSGVELAPKLEERLRWVTQIRISSARGDPGHCKISKPNMALKM
jgi:hypothetical protein